MHEDSKCRLLRVCGGNSFLHPEVHVFDFNEDLYGRHVRVEFVEKIRDEEKYEGLEALKRQIALDCAEARRMLADSRNH